MELLQTQLFKKQIKKLQPNQKRDLDTAIAQLLVDPFLGNAKKGDLTGIRVYKFKMVKQLTLLAYQHYEQKLILIALGSHQNFYRDLKN